MLAFFKNIMYNVCVKLSNQQTTIFRNGCDFMNISGYGSYYPEVSAAGATEMASGSVQFEASVRALHMADEIALAAGADLMAMMSMVTGLGQNIDIFA